MRWVVLAILIAAGLELPRDLHFLRSMGDNRLTVGMTIKIGCGILAAFGLVRGWAAGWAFLLVWCLQGLLMSFGEWQGEGLSASAWITIPVRLALLALIFKERVFRKELNRP
jgi:hypothetical protein